MSRQKYCQIRLSFVTQAIDFLMRICIVDIKWDNVGCKFNSNRITRSYPDENLVFRNEIEENIILENFMYRVVALPNGRAFVIGGARDVNGA